MDNHFIEETKSPQIYAIHQTSLESQEIHAYIQFVEIDQNSTVFRLIQTCSHR